MNILEIGLQKGKELGIKYGLEEGIEKGMTQGIAEGKEQKLIDLVCKKLKKGKSVECIANETEETPEKIAVICRVAKEYAPEYDEQKVYEALKECSKNN